MQFAKHRDRPLTDDEMEQRLRRNMERLEDPEPIAEIAQPAGELSDDQLEALQALDHEEALKVERDALQNEIAKDAEAKAELLKARRQLFGAAMDRIKADVKANNSPDYYPKKRKADREAYAAKIAAEQGRTVRPYRDLSGLTPEQVAAHKREQGRLRKQAERRARRAATI